MPSSTRGSGSGPSRQIRVVRALGGDGSGEETEQKTKTEKLGIGMPDQCVREDSRVLLERCDRLCVVVEVMSGVYHGLEFPSEVSASCGRNPLRPG